MDSDRNRWNKTFFVCPCRFCFLFPLDTGCAKDYLIFWATNNKLNFARGYSSDLCLFGIGTFTRKKYKNGIGWLCVCVRYHFCIAWKLDFQPVWAYRFMFTSNTGLKKSIQQILYFQLDATKLNRTKIRKHKRENTNNDGIKCLLSASISVDFQWFYYRFCMGRILNANAVCRIYYAGQYYFYARFPIHSVSL